jgi:DNA repair protein RadC
LRTPPPSGELAPATDDRAATKALVAAEHLLDILVYGRPIVRRGRRVGCAEARPV